MIPPHHHHQHHYHRSSPWLCSTQLRLSTTHQLYMAYYHLNHVVLLQISFEHVELCVCVVRDGGWVRQDTQIHQRLVHVLRQEHDAHIKHDVLHQKGIVKDEDIHKEEAKIKHIGKHVD